MAKFTKISPCLWFDTEGEEAAKYYTSIFENSRIVRTKLYGPEAPAREGTVLTVEFELDGQPFVVLNGGPQFTFSEAISFYVHCESQAEVDRLWTQLSDGGEEGPCGWLKDRFGVSWQIVPTRFLELINDADPARANRAMQAMMEMKKLDIAELERAVDG
jgi:predicted 3-demethylubiquinone-9 3-methyltransferase (glyoxalase superfamily)